MQSRLKMSYIINVVYILFLPLTFSGFLEDSLQNQPTVNETNGIHEDVSCRVDPYCFPGCKRTTPYCTGCCVAGRCLIGKCQRQRPLNNTSTTQSCVIQAHELSNAECQTDCGVYSKSCLECLNDYMHEECKSLPSYECFPCVKSITLAYEKCGKNQTVDCIKRNISSDCLSCFDTLAMAAASNTPSKENLGKPASVSESVCPPGWSPSYAPNRKCFKVFERTKLSWLLAQKECYDQGYQLAIADTEAEINGIADAMSNQRSESCWIGGSSSSATPLLFDWMPAPQTGHQSFPVETDNWRTKDFCPIGIVTETCMYADRNGDWCNDKCTKSKCYVCESDPEIL